MNSSDIASLFQVLQAAYPHVEFTDDQQMLWANAFENDASHTVLMGARNWIETETFFPSIAGIRQKAREAVLAQQRDRDMSWTPRTDPRETYPPFQDGVAIAAKAWQEDCDSRGVEPNWEAWNRKMNVMQPKAAKKRAYR